MSTITEDFTRTDLRQMRAQWRGSYEGLRWTPWYPLTDRVMSVPKKLVIKQVRVFVNGKWQLSPPGTTSPVSRY